MVPYSLLTLPLRGRLRWQQRAWVWPTPADQSVPDQPPFVQYTFRKGGFYQLLNRTLLYPTPADQSVPDRPPLTPYAFRPGGFWQTQKALLFPTPADQSIPDRPLVPQYIFRRGGFWQTTKFALFPTLTDPYIAHGDFGHIVSDTWRGVGWINYPFILDLPRADRKAVLLALLGSGVITEEEFLALLAAN